MNNRKDDKDKIKVLGGGRQGIVEGFGEILVAIFGK